MSKHNSEKVRAWRTLIDAWKQSGQTINAFCRNRKLTRSNFDRWRRVLARDPGASPREESSSSATPVFVPLRVVAEPIVEVVLVSGIVVRLPLSIAPEAATRLITAVGAAKC